VTSAAIIQAVRLSSRYRWLVILIFLLLAALSVGYLAGHFAITTDSSKLISSNLPWRQQEIRLDRAFPQRTDQIIAVIDATTPEAADAAATALVNDLSPRKDIIRNISRHRVRARVRVAHQVEERRDRFHLGRTQIERI